MIEEIERFSAEDARGKVCVLKDGELLRARPEGRMKITLGPKEQAAADAAIQLLIAGLKDEDGVHVESALTVVGGLIGQFLLLEYRPEWEDVDPECRAVFIEDVDQDLFECAQFLDSLLARRLPGIGGVAAEIPADNVPRPNSLPTAGQALPDIERCLASRGIAGEQRRWVLVFVLGELLAKTAAALHPGIGLRLALRAMVRASKTPAAHLGALEA